MRLHEPSDALVGEEILLLVAFAPGCALAPDMDWADGVPLWGDCWGGVGPGAAGLCCCWVPSPWKGTGDGVGPKAF